DGGGGGRGKASGDAASEELRAADGGGAEGGRGFEDPRAPATAAASNASPRTVALGRTGPAPHVTPVVQNGRRSGGTRAAGTPPPSTQGGTAPGCVGLDGGLFESAGPVRACSTARAREVGSVLLRHKAHARNKSANAHGRERSVRRSRERSLRLGRRHENRRCGSGADENGNPERCGCSDLFRRPRCRSPGSPARRDGPPLAP